MTDQFIVKVQYRPQDSEQVGWGPDRPLITKIFSATDVVRYDKPKSDPHLNFFVLKDDGQRTMHQAIVNGGKGEAIIATTDYHINADAAWVETMQGVRIESLRPNHFDKTSVLPA